jgi:carbonic anhydrase/acetyltransferase-like protein (isoleucine patch superfamily)
MGSVITDSRLGPKVQVGPYSHLRPGSDLRAGVHVGNFVEVKQSILHEDVRANHLTYLGDAVVGAKVNVGAGTITCNYDGDKKSPTIIEASAFIGSNTALVAPVRIGARAYVAAGSTINKNVPADMLGKARSPQENTPLINKATVLTISKSVDTANRLSGSIIMIAKHYGIIGTGDGKQFFFYRLSLIDGEFDNLKQGMEVYFKEQSTEPNEKEKPVLIWPHHR